MVTKNYNGAAERTRTFDLLINSQLHYRAVQRRHSTGTSATLGSTKVFKLSSRHQPDSTCLILRYARQETPYQNLSISGAKKLLELKLNHPQRG